VTPPAIEMVGVSRRHAGPVPLRLRHLVVAAGDRRVIAGLDRGAAEMFVLLVTGAALPDEGTVRINGRDTREISTDTAWLASLDRFGIVTERAVLIDKLPIQANLALPLTLSIDPMTDLVRAHVERLADEVELARARLSAPAASLTASERLRLHLARALALDPGVLLLEHPTATLGEAPARAAFGETLRAVAERRGIGWVALSDDVEFAQRSGGERHRLMAETGEVGAEPLWRRLSAGLRRRS
jgi:ABC-type lipoprotein export system ATPase subunit